MPFGGGGGSAWRSTAAAGIFALVALAVVGGVRSTFEDHKDHAIALEVNTGRQARRKTQFENEDFPASLSPELIAEAAEFRRTNILSFR